MVNHLLMGHGFHGYVSLLEGFPGLFQDESGLQLWQLVANLETCVIRRMMLASIIGLLITYLVCVCETMNTMQ